MIVDVRTTLLATVAGVVAWLAGPVAGQTPASAGGEVIDVQVNAVRVIGPISPYVYGLNGADWAKHPHVTLSRQGGNRMSAYNWENNASNAGSDWQHQNDAFLGRTDVPGKVVRDFVEPGLRRGKAMVVTVPMLDHVAADKNPPGDVRNSPDYLRTRFRKNHPRSPRGHRYPPNLTDDAVYQDEFVWWLAREFPKARRRGRLFYSLDNEPDLWAHTHARVQQVPLTYAGLLDKTVAFAREVKAHDPDGLVFGFVSYGYAGFTNLQGAPDADGRDFIEFFLSSLREREAAEGRVLVDVLDVHWYPEARGPTGAGGGKTERIVNVTGPADHSPGVVAARVQAPRSLWDDAYVEDSWISRDVVGGPVRLLPRLRAKIDRHKPGTKLAITEYNYGGGEHISGAVAQADVLGIYGREGVFAAAFWPLGPFPFVDAAFRAYRDYDGKGGTFGDVAVQALSGKVEDVAVHAGAFADDESKLVLVLVNRATGDRTVRLDVRGFPFTTADLYRIAGDDPKVKPVGKVDVEPGGELALPAMSVTTAVLTKAVPEAPARRTPR